MICSVYPPFSSQESFDERRADVARRAEEEATKPLGFSFKPQTNSKYRFTSALCVLRPGSGEESLASPLAHVPASLHCVMCRPDFHERQATFAERKLRPFEEKLQASSSCYSRDLSSRLRCNAT